MRKVFWTARALFVAVATVTSSICCAQDANSTAKAFTDSMMSDFERQADVEVQAFCADKWPNDYSMQDFCYTSNVEARDKAQAYDLINGPREFMTIWANCAAKWKDDQDRSDWEMTNFCIEEQISALNKIQLRKKN